MEEMKNRYVNASVLMTGTVCLVMVINQIVNSVSYTESAVPGWGYMSVLCVPMLCTWMGLILRYRFRNPRKWAQVLIVVAVLFCMYRYRHFLGYYYWWKRNPYLYLAMMGLGYMAPIGMLDEAGKRKGLEYLALLLSSVFCFTAILVIKSRLQYMAMTVEHQEMTHLMEALANDSELLLAILVAYFAVMFSFSFLGQGIGSKTWFRGIVIFPVIHTFILYLGNLIIHFWRWEFNLLPFLVHPVTVYLAVVTIRLVKRRLSKEEEEERRPIKELLKP